MRYGSLFSGQGLGDFGFELAGLELAWQVERDEYCQKILDLRWPNVKKYKDIKEVAGGGIEKVDLITGGFPCQPFSVAGRKMGKDDDRYLWPEMLRIIKDVRPRWVVGENVTGIVNMAQYESDPPLDPEGNAQGDIGDVYHRRGSGILEEILDSLESIGYEARAVVFPSHALGAWHKRDRIWIVAYTGREYGAGSKISGEHKKSFGSGDASQYQRSNQCGRFGASADPTGERCDSGRCSERQNQDRLSKERTPAKNLQSGSDREHRTCTDGKNVSYTESPERNRRINPRAGRDGSSDSGKSLSYSTRPDDREGRSEPEERQKFELGNCGQLFRRYWKSEPGVGRVVDGCPNRVDRLKGLGNGQVTACTYAIGKFIMEVEKYL